MEFLPQSLAALKSFPQFIVYKLVQNEDKIDKVPVDPVTGWATSPLDPKNWMDADEAIAIAKRLGLGVGFVFTEADPYWFLDIDKCVIDGQWSEIAVQLFNAFPGAAFEISQSGKGLHLFGCGKSPVHGCKNKELGLEFYTERRFVALTGYSAAGNIYQDFTPQLEWLVANYFTGSNSANSGDFWSQWKTEPVVGYGIADDDELIGIASRSTRDRGVFTGKVMPTFVQLWEADAEVLAQAYPPNPNSPNGYDASSADLALAGYIGFYAAGNYDQIQRVMRRSGLYREKWDSRLDYLPRTIVAACGSQTSYFTGKNTKAQVNVTMPDCQRPVLNEYDYPEMTAKGKPLNTAMNLKFLLDRLGIVARWNNMSRTRDVTIPGEKIFYDDKDNSALTLVTDIALRNGLPITRVDELLTSIAQVNAFHPIVEAMKANPWDGIPRVDQFIATLKTTNNALAYRLVKKWMTCAMAAAHSEYGFANQGVLVLAGKQGIGKTYWVKSLDPIGCRAVKEGALLDPSNKDSLMTVTGCWVAELGELDGTFRKADIARVKGFTTASEDTFRLPYAKKNSTFPRRTVFAATVNETRFLTDDTGNRRWWTIEIEHIERHSLDILQVWAEVYHYWNGGESTELSAEDRTALDIGNMQHEQIDPIEERFTTHFDWSKPGIQKMNATQALFAVGYSKPGLGEVRRAGNILTKLTGKKYDRHRCHLLPEVAKSQGT